MSNKTLWCWNIYMDDDYWNGVFDSKDDAINDAIANTAPGDDIYIGTCHWIELPDTDSYIDTMLEYIEEEYYDDILDSDGCELFPNPCNKSTSEEYKQSLKKFKENFYKLFKDFCDENNIKPTHFEVDDFDLYLEGKKNE